MLYYIYSGDELLGFIYKNVTYYYHKNILGDIIGILDSNYKEIVTYTYDSYGSIKEIIDTSNNNIGSINPFRYRSYYYDEETKLYYLNSRYYNPQWGRFVNADNGLSKSGKILENNIFCYTNNNPVNYNDISGEVAGFFLSTLFRALKNNQKKQKEKSMAQIKKVQAVNNQKNSNVCVEFRETLTKNSQKVEEDLGKEQNFIKKLLDFKNLVDNGKEYDLKKTSTWKNKTIYYDGMWMEAQDLGNYHYGYIGRAAGIPTSVLIAGAGYNQWSNWKFKTIENCPTTSLCDDPRDLYFIKRELKHMKENTNKKTLIVLLLLLFLIILLLVPACKKVYDWLYESQNYNVEEVINDKYDFFQKNEEEFKKMVIQLEENEIVAISRKSTLDRKLYKEFEIDGLYFYSNNDLDLSQLKEDFLFFKKSDLEQIYLQSEDYYFLFSTSKNYSTYMVYCKGNCNLEDYKKEVRKGDMVKYSITKKMNENWALMFSDLPL